MRAKLEWQSKPEAISPSDAFACPKKTGSLTGLPAILTTKG